MGTRTLGAQAPSMHRRTALRFLFAAAFCTVLGRRALGFTVKPDASCALLIIDVQNCFVKGGTLPVPHGEEVVPAINRIAPAFQNVIMTQDWHGAGHVSFASAHPGRKPFEIARLPYGDQVLWPDHCVQGTADASLYPGLHVPQAQLILRKGFHAGMDSYSAFKEADRTTPTGLEGYLKQRGIHCLFIAGLATDFCVASTVLDAREAGFQCYVIEDACRGIDLNGSVAKAWQMMSAAGAVRIQSSEIPLL
jgi:nicotinamidase/pyrazinamidase